MCHFRLVSPGSKGSSKGNGPEECALLQHTSKSGQPYRLPNCKRPELPVSGTQQEIESRLTSLGRVWKPSELRLMTDKAEVKAGCEDA